MVWGIETHEAFDPEFNTLRAAVQDELLAMLILLRATGSHLGRPHADTLAGSRHANMKELRFTAAGSIWRVVFAFDPRRRRQERHCSEGFYKALITKADARDDNHLAALSSPQG